MRGAPDNQRNEPMLANVEEVALLPVSRREAVRVLVGTHGDRRMVDIRRWFFADDGLRPSKKGVMLEADHLSELAAAVLKAESIHRAGPAKATKRL